LLLYIAYVALKESEIRQ